MTKPDMVSHPPHYTSSPARCRGCGLSIECIDVIEHQTACIAMAMKYLWRCDLKGSPIEDLEKSIWYIRREIERRQRAEIDEMEGLD
jgi:hypothetical protein